MPLYSREKATSMLEFTETGADDVVGIRVGGSVTSEDIERAIDKIDSKLDQHDQVSFIAEIETLSGVSPAALLKDITYGIQQLRHLDRFHRAAVVTDKRWIRAAVKIESKLLPGVQVKAFFSPERDEAYAWAKNSRAA